MKFSVDKLSDHIELSEEEQVRLLAEYEAERKQIMKERKTDEKDVDSGTLIEREKKDMIIVSTSATTSTSGTSSTEDKGKLSEDHSCYGMWITGLVELKTRMKSFIWKYKCRAAERAVDFSTIIRK